MVVESLAHSPQPPEQVIAIPVEHGDAGVGVIESLMDIEFGDGQTVVTLLIGNLPAN
ncbi:MAG: hypothetical protein KDJ39_17500 [Gammaproteobacteria bacterium]|nr:hypothetical protein [Gammaproteobacteria bacterium]